MFTWMTAVQQVQTWYRDVLEQQRRCKTEGRQASSSQFPVVLPGAVFSLTAPHEAHVDQKNKVVTTPAFMCETALHHIHDGIGAMVKKVLELTGK